MITIRSRANKKTLLRIFAVALLAVMIAAAGSLRVNAFASSTKTSGDWVYYVRADGTVRIEGWKNQKKTSVTVPAQLGGAPVAAIGEEVFKKTNIQSVEIPEGVTSIGKYAFDGCNELRRVTLPESIKYLEKGCFHFCKKLEEINIPDSIQEIGEKCFFECESLRTIHIPPSVSVLPAEVFEGCAMLEEIDIPETVRRIERGAFMGCTGLLRVSFPGTEIQIDENPFNICSKLREVIIPEGHPNLEMRDGCLIEKNEQRLIWYQLSRDSKSYTVPDGVVSLGIEAFDGADLEELILPEGVEKIGDYCFLSCRSLRTVKLPESLRTIEKRAFYENRKLSEITLPRGLREIQSEAIYKCENLLCYVYPDSRGYRYCVANNLAYKVIDGETKDPAKETFEEQFVRNPDPYSFVGIWENTGVLMGTDVCFDEELTDPRICLGIGTKGSFGIVGTDSFWNWDEFDLKQGCLTLGGKTGTDRFRVRKTERGTCLIWLSDDNPENGVILQRIPSADYLTLAEVNPLNGDDTALYGRVYQLEGKITDVFEQDGYYTAFMMNLNPAMLVRLYLMDGAEAADALKKKSTVSAKPEAAYIGQTIIEGEPLLQFAACWPSIRPD